MRAHSFALISAVCLMLVIPHLSALALVESVGLAGMETVMPSGPGDCGRNPALLPFNDVTFAFGGFGSYRPISRFDTSTKIETNAFTLTGLENGQKDIINASAAGGMIFRTAHSGFGIMLNAQDDQYSKTEGSMKLTGTMSPAAATTILFSQKSENSSRTVNPAGEISWGYRTSDNFSFGLRLTGLYGTKSTVEKNESNTVMDAAGTITTAQEKTTTTTDIKTIGGALKIGFLFRDENTEAGILFSTGDILRRTSAKEISMTKVSTIDPLQNGNYTGKADSDPYITSPSPSIAIGFRWMMKWVDIAGEGKIGSSKYSEYSDPSFYVDTMTGTLITTKQSMEVETGLDCSGRAGLVFHPATWLQFFTGGAFIMNAQRENYNKGNKESSSTSKIYLASTALQLTPWKHITFGAGAFYGYVRINSKTRENNFTSSFSSTSRMNIAIANVYTGVSMQF